jgi:hypothetical protein
LQNDLLLLFNDNHNNQHTSNVNIQLSNTNHQPSNNNIQQSSNNQHTLDNNNSFFQIDSQQANNQSSITTFSNELNLAKQIEALKEQNQLLKVQLNNLSNNSIQNNTQANVNSANNNFYQQQNYRNIDHNKIYYQMDKLLRYEHHIKTYDIHFETKTTPSSLFYTRFPRPMFFDNNDYLNKYNKLIEEFQTEAMKINYEEFKSRINETKTKLNNLKNTYNHVPDIDTYFENIKRDAENNNFNSFNKKYSAITRYISRPLNKDSFKYYKNYLMFFLV